jgi:T4-like virus tail tube protein gp19
MPFNVSTFASNGLPYGGARASLFEVTLRLPGGIGEPTAQEQFRFVCKASSIPASTLGSIDVPYFGRKVKMAGNRTFDNWSVTVMNDENFFVRHAFEKWSSFINSHENNLRNSTVSKESSFNNTYRTQAKVLHYAKTGVYNGGSASGGGAIPTRQYTFENIFPVSIGNIELNWETTDAIEEFTVEFAYDYWNVLADVNSKVIFT